MKPGRATALVLVALAVGISMLASLAMWNRRDQLAHLNEEIQYDDFAFSVLDLARVPSLGNGTRRVAAKGGFCIVTFKVANHAKRVDFKFRPESVVLVDERGRQYHLADAAQAVLDQDRGGAPCAAPIKAGSSCTTKLVFDVPTDAGQLDVRLSFSNRFTDLLDLVFWGFKRIRLPG